MSRVEIYTRGFCSFCFRAKALLERRGIAYEEIDISTDPAGQARMIERAGGRRTVPQIFIDGRGIGGCDELHELDREGELEELAD